MFSFSYPIIYSVIIVPLSVVRWIQFSQEDRGKGVISASWIITVEAIHSLGGFLDVSLFLLTKRGLLLFGNSRAPLVSGEEKPPDEDEENEKFYGGAPLGRLPSLAQAPAWDLPCVSAT